MSGLSGVCTVTASTKRKPAPVSGVIGAAVTKLSSLKIMPLMPTSAQIIEKYKLRSPRESYTTGAEGAMDIIEGDILTIGSESYNIVGVEKFTAPVAYIRMVIEKVAGT